MKIEETAKKSGELFETGYFCAESVLLSIAESKNVQSPLIPRLASGFCSGTTRMSQMCGAVSGAIMAIGLLHGRDNGDDSIETCYRLVQKFVNSFTDRFGSSNCRELTGCDLATERGQQEFKDNNMIEKCQDFVKEATRMVLSITEVDS